MTKEELKQALESVGYELDSFSMGGPCEMTHARAAHAVEYWVARTPEGQEVVVKAPSFAISYDKHEVEDIKSRCHTSLLDSVLDFVTDPIEFDRKRWVP